MQPIVLALSVAMAGEKSAIHQGEFQSKLVPSSLYAPSSPSVNHVYDASGILLFFCYMRHTSVSLSLRK